MFAHHSNAFAIGIPALCASVGPMGLFAGTKLETETGWRDVAELTPGDRLYTMDGGLRPLRALRAEAGTDDAVRLPAGVLGADAETSLPPGQLLLLETGWAIDWLGTPVALVRAADLVGHLGIRRRAAPATTLLAPVLGEEEVLFAATGLRVFAAGAATLIGPEHFALLTREEVGPVLEAAPCRAA
ncbi:Hint domain-containing protein [Histidinibacterium lentulum]|nr:Hint domain-containing protein [Histidinibacterium lentulum]